MKEEPLIAAAALGIASAVGAFPAPHVLGSSRKQRLPRHVAGYGRRGPTTNCGSVGSAALDPSPPIRVSWPVQRSW